MLDINLILFNLIFSQDTLRTTDGKELAGKFISIVDKGIEFKIENSSRPILYPFESIVEITDSNGTLILNSTTLSLRAAKKERRKKLLFMLVLAQRQQVPCYFTML